MKRQVSVLRPLLCLAAALSLGSACVANDPDDKAQRTEDYVVKAYPAQLFASGLAENQLASLKRKMACDEGPFAALQDAARPKKQSDIQARTAYLVQIGEWNTLNGSYSLVSSTWYVYRAAFSNEKCLLEQTGLKASGQPLLYGDKIVWFLGINHFRDPIDPKNISVAYKVSATPAIAESVQDLGLLVMGILGATSTVTPYKNGVPSKPPTDTLVSAAKIYGLRTLPFDLNIALSLTLNQPGGLPAGRIGTAYAATVSASGGNGNYNYVVIQDSLPDGLGLDSETGSISGTPATAGDSTFTVRIQDTSTPPNVAAVRTHIRIAPASVVTLKAAGAASPWPSGIVGVPYAASVAPKGGSGNYSFSSMGNLPPGLALDPTSGAIYKVPSAAGNFNFTIHVTDQADPSITVDVPVAITIAAPSQSLSYSVVPFQILPSGAASVPYSASIGAKGGNGTNSFTIDGNLPPGLTINSSSGVISGVPTVPSNYSFTVHIEDTSSSPNATAVRAQIAIKSQPVPDPSVKLAVAALAQPNGSLPDGTVDVPYSALLAVIDGTGPYSYSNAAGLPYGLELSKSGSFTGSPSTAGDFQISFSVQDMSIPPIKRSFKVPLAIKLPLIAVTLGGASSGNTPRGNSGAPQNAGPTNGPSNNASHAAGPSAGPSGAPQNSAATPQQVGGKASTVGQNNSSGPTNSGSNSVVTTVDCSAVSQGTPCSLNRTFRTDAREAFDFGVGIGLPGVREKIFSPTVAPHVTTHADVYGFFDVYPAAYWKPKESWVPHFNFGIPLTSQSLHRPYFGIGENLTSWTGAEKAGFPLPIIFFVGLVDMKQQIFVTPFGQTTPILKYDRALKPLYGIELPIGAIVNKITGGAKGSGTAAGGKGGTSSSSP
jgi:hypothetical protein